MLSLFYWLKKIKDSSIRRTFIKIIIKNNCYKSYATVYIRNVINKFGIYDKIFIKKNYFA